MMRSSVLSLCKENYSCAIEVDGLICISVLNSPEQHVVKIHDLLTENGQFINAMSISSLKTQSTNNTVNSPSANTASNIPSSKAGNSPQPVLVVQNSATTSQTPTSTSTLRQAIARDKSNNTDENISRFPFLVQTLKESQRNQNRAASASPTIPSHGQHNILSLGQHNTPCHGQQSIAHHGHQSRSLYGNLPTNPPLVDNDRPASSLLKMLSSQKQHLQPQPNVPSKQSSETGQVQTTMTPKQYDDGQVQVPVQETNDSGNLIMNIKEEPVDEAMHVQQETSTENSSTGNLVIEQPDPVKKEPEWNAGEYGGNMASNQVVMVEKSNEISSAGNKDSTVKQKEGNDSTDEADRKKSILANILEGKEETYSKRREAVGNFAPANSSKDTCDEPDSSLLYRLPYTDFKDLFPASSNIADRKRSGNHGKPQGKRGKSELDKIMRKMLDDRKSSQTKKQPPRKKKKTVYYEEFDSMSSDCEDGDSLDLLSEKEEDDIYVPTGYERSELGVSKGTDPDFSMSLRTKTIKKTTKRAVAVKSTTKQLRPRELRYTCYHCHLRFHDSEERDKHEENSCTAEHGLIECEVCKGFFANSSSKNKHMFEIHSILPEEQKEEIQATRKGAASEFKTIEQNPFEFETLRSSCNGNGDRLQFDVEASAFEDENSLELVTKFIVPYSVQNDQNFIKCPLCLNMFSDKATKDQHLQIKHRIANQIDNGDGTISLQVREHQPSSIPPVYVKYEQADD